MALTPKQKRTVFGGGKTHSGLLGLGANDKAIAKAKDKAKVKKASDATKKRMRTGDPDAPLFNPKKKKPVKKKK
tara:strand:- start:1198 stop:1419 length:222 start_codon:yes stop_codon:yes gene_type:complete